jgi:hypothetical protein
VATYLFADTIVILRTGHIPGLFRGRLQHRMLYGPITKKSRPQRFWIYVLSNVAVLVLALMYIALSLFFLRN